MAQPVSVLFFGTETFGAAMLEALIGDSAFKVIGVVTQPDRPVGRKKELHQSPVKNLALQRGIPVFQPETLKTIEIVDPDSATEHSLSRADLQIVCQYGLIIPGRIVEAPRCKTLNVHTSLLPRYRGASPIQTALMHGERETGITIMRMDEKMDHGPIVAQKTVLIDPDDTTPSLSLRMIPIAQQLLAEAARGWAAGTIEAQAQNEADVTFCRLFTTADGLIDFSKTAEEIYNRYRGLFPWPGSFTYWNGILVKFLKIKLAPNVTGLSPGTVAVVEKKIFIGTASHALQVETLQKEGGKPLEAAAFIAGARDFDGASLRKN